MYLPQSSVVKLWYTLMLSVSQCSSMSRDNETQDRDVIVHASAPVRSMVTPLFLIFSNIRIIPPRISSRSTRLRHSKRSSGQKLVVQPWWSGRCTGKNRTPALRSLRKWSTMASKGAPNLELRVPSARCARGSTMLSGLTCCLP